MAEKNDGANASEFEECWCSTKAEALEIAAALSIDYPSAQVDVLDSAEAQPDWVVDLWYAEEHESCAFFTEPEARSFAEALAADYADRNSASPATEITIKGPRGRLDYVLGSGMAIAV